MKLALIAATAALTLVGMAQSTVYDSTIAKRLVYYSGATYCKESTLANWGCGPACQNEPGVTSFTPVQNEASGTFGYVAYNSKVNEIIVAFRGSHNIANWIDNMDFKKTQYPGGPSGAQVHSGFFNSYMTMQQQMLSAVRSLVSQHSTATILVTGHSLGAAQSIFGALDIKNQINPKNRMILYNFGCPRPGNQAFTDYVMSHFPDYKRVVHTDDCVPHVPLSAMGFNHAGEEVWYNESGNLGAFKICTNTIGKPENAGCSDTILVGGTAAHTLYLGIQVTSQCTQKAAVFDGEFTFEDSTVDQSTQTDDKFLAAQ